MRCPCIGCDGRQAHLAEQAERERELDRIHNRPKRINFYRMLEQQGIRLTPEEVTELAVWQAEQVKTPLNV